MWKTASEQDIEALDEGTRLQDGIQHGVGILFQKFFCDFQAVAVSFAFDRGSGADAVFLRPFRDRVFDVIGAAAGVSGDFDFEDRAVSSIALSRRIPRILVRSMISMPA